MIYTFTMIVMMFAGYDFQKNPVALSGFTVVGFTSEQACESAKSKLLANQLTDFDSTNIRTKVICVPTNI